jgi:hypothetical protein
MSQSEHWAWNARNYPGTRQLCEQCGEPTGRCEEDSLYGDEDGEIGPLCEECCQEANRKAVGNCPGSLHSVSVQGIACR